MQNSKASVFAVGATVLCLFTFAAQASSSLNIDQSLAVTAGGQVRFKILDGDVQFVGWDKNTVQVQGRLRSESDELVFKNDGADILIHIETKHSSYHSDHGHDSYRSSTKLTVYMPASTPLFAQGTSGNFEITGIKAGVRAKNVSGDIDIHDSASRIEAYSASGDITVLNSQGEVLVETVSGDLQAQVQSKRFSASTISGDIEAELGNAERVQLSSVSGEVTALMNLSNAGSVEASTVSGDIDLVFNQSKLDAHFDITTGPGGDIRNKLTDDRPSQSWIESELLEFKVGKGTAQIELETVSGSITVSKD